MIGIIGAMQIEVAKLKEKIKVKKTETVSGVEFTVGKLEKTDVCIAVSGVGKVNAAVCAEAMILKYSPSLIINTGVGGTLSDNLKIGDIALSDIVVEHDMDTTPLGEPKGYISGLDLIKMYADIETLKKLENIISKLNINYQIGTIASGDQFINSDKAKTDIKKEFNAVCCEMEGASIGHVCLMNDVPFCVIRAISDGADENSHMSFPEFTELAANNTVKVLTEFLK